MDSLTLCSLSLVFKSLHTRRVAGVVSSWAAKSMAEVAELFVSGEFNRCKELLERQLAHAADEEKHLLHLNIACCLYQLSLYR